MATLNRTVERGGPFDAFVMPEAKRDGVPPAKRLAEHLASKANVGPDPGGTVRITMRGKAGGEKGAEASLVRRMYDIANKPTRRKRRKPRTLGCKNGCPAGGVHKSSCELAGKERKS